LTDDREVPPSEQRMDPYGAVYGKPEFPWALSYQPELAAALTRVLLAVRPRFLAVAAL